MKKNTETTKNPLILLVCFSLLWKFVEPVFSSNEFHNNLNHPYPVPLPVTSNEWTASSFDSNYQYEPQKDLASYPQSFGQRSVLPSDDWHWTLKDENKGWDITLFDKYPEEDQARLWYQTKITFGLALGVLGVIALLPESVSKWDKSEVRPIKKWWENVKSGPVWDTDEWYINYIGHPYFGGVYYVMARSSGYNQWNSFVYSFLMSTFLYEYGIEAMCERPSIQDIIVTPLGGWLYGEWAYQKKLKILDNDSEVMGSKGLGSTVLFLLDPVGKISQWVSGDDEDAAIQNLSIRLSVMPPASSFSSYRKRSLDLDDRYFGVEVFFNF
ncbi:DUF3943 domain-containing protein [Endozoicomonas elysicola]|uniref:DUF3943 domain-containing protein n=1 Tax=Endozoicomonas elysicola TaxID=305900 RepID=UPI000372FF98|nr:DUF3943 domain-containing protein [Endozoicomonas elysicola]